ncbi:MAG: putative S-layer protein [Nanoarchaeota archaeon]|mgnify:CR=1 FL=1
MESKKIFLGLFALLSAVLLVSVVGAATLSNPFDVSFPSTINHDAGSFDVTFKINNSAGADTLTLTSTDTGSADLSTIVFTPSSPISVADGSTTVQTVSVKATFTFASKQDGTLAGTITITPGAGSAKTLSFGSITINNAPAFTGSKGDEISFTKNGTYVLGNTGNKNLTLALSSSGAFTVKFLDGLNQISSLSLLKSTSSKTITVVPTSDLTVLNFGSHSITVNAVDSANNVQDSETYTLTKSFCKAGSIGSNLTINGVDISNEDGDEEEWLLLETIKVDVDVENTGSDTVRDVFVEFALFDSAGNDVTSKIDFLGSDDEKVDLGNIGEDDEETASFEFRVPGDLDDGSYKLAVKAYSRDAGEEKLCADRSSDLSNTFYQSITVDRENDEGKFIRFDDIILSPTEATCSDRVSLSLDVVNVGDEDQDQVKVKLINRDLGVDLTQEIRNDLDIGDDTSLEFAFDIPSNTADKTYVLELVAEYDYKNGVYREVSDDSERIPFRIFGCSESDSNSGTSSGTGISISANLDSDAIPGEQMTVSVTVSNTASEQKVFTVGARGFSSWAELDSISETSFILTAGQSKEVTLKLTPKADVSGEKLFTFEARTEDSVRTREIAVDFGDAKKTNIFGDNTLIWVIGIINVILIILIIVVAVRVSRA